MGDRRLASMNHLGSRSRAASQVKPIIEDIPLDEIVEPHRYLESNQQVGKIVVTV